MNNRMSARGAITLLMTSALLAVTLMTSLAMMKTVFYQFKRAQNELKQRQLHWRAEGAVECAVALVGQYEHELEAKFAANPVLDFEHCANQMRLDEVAIEQRSPKTYRVYAVDSHFQLSRYYAYPRDVTDPDFSAEFYWLAGGWTVE
ncbi:hypothetical protein [Vibrio sinaloensis]|uniref:hypothetical protein n=1 Tax=Photobacterium sp. (strain ATCC 43367) TaxID=379097 RepID=UPI002058FBCD|nr:hypothetical protein [Vibrio sinaloensis]UPQ87343.1 hypothetical protein MTO69_09940 [Vibrio sinaloensis]